MNLTKYPVPHGVTTVQNSRGTARRKGNILNTISYTDETNKRSHKIFFPGFIKWVTFLDPVVHLHALKYSIQE
jgi:hypothetical protein